jgi:hypothetical protein
MQGILADAVRSALRVRLQRSDRTNSKDVAGASLYHIGKQRTSKMIGAAQVHGQLLLELPGRLFGKRTRQKLSGIVNENIRLPVG